jgi:hypothetical protein
LAGFTPAAQTTHESSQAALAGRRHAFFFEGGHDALETHAEPDARHARTAEHLGKTVVPATAEEGGGLRLG